MENAIVIYKEERWTCDLPVRRSLFHLYQKSDPNFMVYLHKEHSYPKLVKVSEIVLCTKVLIT